MIELQRSEATPSIYCGFDREFELGAESYFLIGRYL